MTSLNLVVLRVADLERSRLFYSELGLVFVGERHGSGPEHLSAKCGPLTFELYPTNNQSQSSSGIRLGFQVDELDQVLPRLLQQGGTLIKETAASPWGLRAVVDDPDEYRIEVTQTTVE